MSELTNPQPAKARPGAVTASSYLLYLAAALQVLSLIMMLAVFSDVQSAYEAAFEGTDLDGAATVATAALVGSALFGLLVAVGLVVLAILNNRGKNPARIVTWVVGGIYLCCAGFSLMGNALGGAVGAGPSGGGNVPDQEEIQRRLDETMPSWFEPVNTLLSVISLLALLVALILLALPAANEFFKRPAPAWEPPLPGSSYPTAPGSAYPTYPPSAGPPTTPPAPGTTPPAAPPPTPPAGPGSSPGDGNQPPQPPAS